MIRKIFRAAAAVLLVVLGVACTPQQMLLNSLIPDGTVPMLLSHLENVESGNRDRIIELERKGDWREMVRFADTNIKTDPFSSEWRMIGGYASSQLREFPRAVEYFSDMVRLSPDDPTAYHFLAEAQRASGDARGAVTTLERALLVVRESALTYRLLGDAYVDLARYAAAIAAYRRALTIDPGLPDAWFGLGRAASLSGRTADVRQALQALDQMRSPRAAELRTLAGMSQ
ncbi:MAG: tetratricopeptide repeat protein [Betaproteobacteria bacterium]|nr:tetratricopeptide repeat protein [Betaproteobacteria bacterium]MDH4292503.1 tetratricopeptide repeat protein [Betaproteobacteria bacterium]MDH5342477.1 tetratricopeptide repeat protein [Betaproteobacteria bacterium]